jgi:hypothetical protein
MMAQRVPSRVVNWLNSSPMSSSVLRPSCSVKKRRARGTSSVVRMA